MTILWFLIALGLNDPDSKLVAVTFDDLPFNEAPSNKSPLNHIRQWNEKTLAVLKAHRVSAVGFVNTDKVFIQGEMDARYTLLERWLVSGHHLGNHTYGHVDFNRVGPEAYGWAIKSGEVAVRELVERYGKSYTWFRPPYTHTGSSKQQREAFEKLMDRFGYRLAVFTLENVDYAFNRHYTAALASGDGARTDKVLRAYLQHTTTMLSFMEELGSEVFGRTVPQVLLLHTNRINVDALDGILKLFKERGYVFATLDEVAKDPMFDTADNYFGPSGPSWIHRWSLVKGYTMVKRGKGMFPETLLREPDPPAWIFKAPEDPNP